MQKTIFVILTILIGLLPWSLSGINIPLSFECYSPALCHSTGYYSPPDSSIQLSVRLGKVIKESQIEKGTYQIKTIVIDPGHGGHDPGCLGRGSKEKHLALAVGKKLAEVVQARFPTLKVIMTRDRDVFVPLHERAAIANRNNADLFISIHCNSMPAGHPYVRGTETYVMGLHTANHNLNVAKRENASILLEENYEKNYDYDPNSTEGHIMLAMYQNAYLEQSILFAEKVESEFNTFAQRKSRGVKQAGFVVLKETTMPSVLVETGFLSNRKEEKYLRTKAGQEQIAIAILRAFEGYKAQLEGTPNQVYSTPATIPVKETMAERSPFVPTPTPPSTPSIKQEQKVIEKPKLDYTPPPPRGVTVPDVYRESKIISSTPPIELPQEPKKQETRPLFMPSPVEQQNQTLPAASNVVKFHVQLAASPKKLDTSGAKWQNLGYMVEIIVEGKLYKYQARNFSSFQQALDARALLKTKGFSDAFVVAYKNGERISIEQAKREQIRP